MEGRDNTDITHKKIILIRAGKFISSPITNINPFL
jgi:hypothetical protein